MSRAFRVKGRCCANYAENLRLPGAIENFFIRYNKEKNKLSLSIPKVNSVALKLKELY